MVWQGGWIGQALAVLGLVWLTNLYNFMDGIDAIAAIEGVSVAVLAAFILLGFAVVHPVSWLALTAAGCAGFLLWNWPPARIFMGDVGSGFLGYVLGVMAYATSAQGLNLWCWVILLGVFLVDATVTLLRRLATHQRWWEPHRSHAYQYAARRWRSHARVSLSVVCINVFWLGPLAWVGAHYPAWAAGVAAVAILPLIAIALALGAGSCELPPASAATVGSEK
jgi:Fuc2NAc and GlcNAc transferase